MVRPSDNTTALSMLLVVPASVEDLARLLGGEVLLALHGLGPGSLAITAGTLLALALSTLGPTAFVRLLGRTPMMSLHGFRHYTVSGENHDACGLDVITTMPGYPAGVEAYAPGSAL